MLREFSNKNFGRSAAVYDALSAVGEAFRVQPAAEHGMPIRIPRARCPIGNGSYSISSKDASCYDHFLDFVCAFIDFRNFIVAENLFNLVS